MERISELIGKEHDYGTLCRDLKYSVQDTGLSVVGGMELSCSDEAVYESADRFQRDLWQSVLPSLKHGHRSPFRVCVPGASYPVGAVRVAEANFSSAARSGDAKVLVIRVCAHVAVERMGHTLRFGVMRRYETETSFCSALASLLADGTSPLLTPMRYAFRQGGVDRIAILNDDDRVDPDQRLLKAACLQARLQARQVTLDVQDHTPLTPTLYYIVHGVTLNRPGVDSELIGGVYSVDRTGSTPHDRYVGIGDDPSRYSVTESLGRLQIADDKAAAIRAARDHRKLVALHAGSASMPRPGEHDALDQRREAVRGSEHHLGPYAKAALKTTLAVVAEVAPYPAALVLFTEGVLELHQAHLLSQAAAREEQDAIARQLLHGAHAEVDELTDDEAAKLHQRLLHPPQR